MKNFWSKGINPSLRSHAWTSVPGTYCGGKRMGAYTLLQIIIESVWGPSCLLLYKEPVRRPQLPGAPYAPFSPSLMNAGRSFIAWSAWMTEPPGRQAPPVEHRQCANLATILPAPLTHKALSPTPTSLSPPGCTGTWPWTSSLCASLSSWPSSTWSADPGRRGRRPRLPGRQSKLLWPPPLRRSTLRQLRQSSLSSLVWTTLSTVSINNSPLTNTGLTPWKHKDSSGSISTDLSPSFPSRGQTSPRWTRTSRTLRTSPTAPETSSGTWTRIGPNTRPCEKANDVYNINLDFNFVSFTSLVISKFAVIGACPKFKLNTR